MHQGTAPWQSEHVITLTDGRHLGYALYGDPAGKPVLYFHGGMSSRLDIRFAYEHCARAGLYIIAPDRPGTGQSSRQAGRTMADWAKDVVELLDQLQIDRVPLMGWSVGGPYALTCAYQIPQRITTVATIGSAMTFDSPEAVKALGLMADRLLLTCPQAWRWLLAALLCCAGKLPPALIKMELEREVQSAPDRTIIKALSTSQGSKFIIESVAQGGYGVVDDYAAVAQHWGFALSEIKIPVHIYHGELDAICPLSAAHYLADNIKGSILELVPDEGHFLLHHKIADVLSTLLHSQSQTQT